MKRYLLARLVGLGLVLLGMSLLVFLLMAYVPGSTASALLGPYATPERVQQLEQSLGLDRPLPLRYLIWLAHVLRLDWGYAYSLQRPVADAVAERLWPTLLLALTALGVGSLAGLSLGVASARHHGRARDRLISLASLLGLSVPAFWLAMSLILLFSVSLRWFPVSGLESASGPGRGELLDQLRHLVLPALALGVVPAGVIARLMRGEMLEALSSPYVGMARAKGLAERRIVEVHAFRSALSRIVPVIGLQAGFVIGGAVYVESVFQWPGLGRLLVEAVAARDLQLVQGGVLVMASAYSLVILLSDLAQRALDPRLGSGR